MSFHPYVCLAILSECEEELLETENPELKGALAMLPALQMDRIVTQVLPIASTIMFEWVGCARRSICVRWLASVDWNSPKKRKTLKSHIHHQR